MPPSDPSGPVPEWSSDVRGWVSLALFIHLFAVVVAVTTYTRPSGLQQQLHDVFAVYLRNLHLTAYPVSYPFARFHLTHGPAVGDADYAIEVALDEGAQGEATYALPPPGIWPDARQRRYRALASAAANLSNEDLNGEASNLLPRAIAASLLKRSGTDQGSIRIRRHALPDIFFFAEASPTARDAAFASGEPIYDAQVFLSGGTAELIRKSTTLEVAPVRTPPPRESDPRR